MSGFNTKTGWCHFTPKKIRRYFRQIEGESDFLKDRFSKKSIPAYMDRSGGLHAKCADGELWHILSGLEIKFSTEMPPDSELEPEYVNVTVIGENLNPPLSSIKTNLLLKKYAFQVKNLKVWEVTKKGKRYSFKEQSSYGNKTFLRWSWEIIKILQDSLA